MAEKKQKEATPKEIRNRVKERVQKAKAAGTGFREFFATTATEFPQLKEATVYQWWQAVKGGGSETRRNNATAGHDARNPSERLALLLKKEGALVDKVRRVQAELASVRREVETLWNSRQKGTQATAE